MDVATDDVKVEVLGDLAEALRERHERIQQKIASVRRAMGLADVTTDTDVPSRKWEELHPRQRLAAGL